MQPTTPYSPMRNNTITHAPATLTLQHTHTRTTPHTRTPTHSHPRILTLQRTHTPTHSHSNTLTLQCTHIPTHSHSNALTLQHTHTRTPTHSHPQTLAHQLTHRAHTPRTPTRTHRAHQLTHRAHNLLAEKIEYLSHKVQHQSRKRLYRCSECLYTTRIQRNFHRHSTRHLVAGPVKCRACSYSSTGEAAIQRHMTEYHDVDADGHLLVQQEHSTRDLDLTPRRQADLKRSRDSPTDLNDCSLVGLPIFNFFLPLVSSPLLHLD